MASWGHRQQAKIIGTAIVIAVVLIGLAAYYGFFNHQPTCFDGKQNGNETGIDCGGSCQKVCLADILNPLVKYTRIFQAGDGLYGAVAIIENPNPLLLAENVPYTFKVFDKDGVEIVERHGTIFIPPHKTIPIFEGGLKTGIRVPAKLAFQFDQPPSWQRSDNFIEPPLQITNENFNMATGSARLDADLLNQNPDDFKNITVIALLYDDQSNVFAGSQTVVDTLNRRSSVHLVFTWPRVFAQNPYRVEIIPELPLSDFIQPKR